MNDAVRAGEMTIEHMAARLQQLESEHAVRRCMQRYMAICDQLDARSPLDELVGLFTNDAIWEGVGDKYAQTFGRLQGAEAIRAMFASYATEPAHFVLNAHFLSSELIEVGAAGSATGHWMMLQASTYASGESHLAAARLTVDFRPVDGQWKMAHFRTRSLFGRPVSAWTSAALMPVPRNT